MAVNSSANSVILIVFALSDNLREIQNCLRILESTESTFLNVCKTNGRASPFQGVGGGQHQSLFEPDKLNTLIKLPTTSNLHQTIDFLLNSCWYETSINRVAEVARPRYSHCFKGFRTTTATTKAIMLWKSFQ